MYQKIENNVIVWRCIGVGGGGGGGGVKANTKKSVISQQTFIQKALYHKRKVGGVKVYHFLKILFKIYSKINVWWLFLPG